MSKILSYPFTITVASGTGSASTALFLPMKDAGGFIRQIIVNAPNAADLFNLYITNPNLNVMFRRKNLEGELIEACDIPVVGTYNFVISSASTDGTYNVEIMFLEKY